MDSETNKILAAIHKDYVKELPQRIVKLELAWSQITKLESDGDTLSAYCKEVHDLSGSSGTHGYKELSKILRELDKLLSNLEPKKMEFINKDIVNYLLKQAEMAALIPPDTPDMFKEY